MVNVTSEELNATLNSLGIDLKTLIQIYPDITKPLISLKSTGVSKRNYSHWKKVGLVRTNGVKGSWVKLNLFQYIWLKTVEALRDFGVSIPIIKQVQEFLYTDVFEGIKSLGQVEQNKALEEIAATDPQKHAAILKVIEWVVNMDDLFSKEDMILKTFLSSLVSNVLLQNEEINLVLCFNGDKLVPEIYSQNSKLYGDESVVNGPHLRIPIRTIIEDFFSNPETEKFAESFGLITKYESKVLNSLRKNEYKEIVIYSKVPDMDIIIKEIEDLNLREQKVRELMAILGRNKYDKIVVTQMNGEKIILKNKLELYSSAS